VENGDAQAQALQRGLRLTLGVRAVIGAPVQIIKHAYTHFSVSAHVFECEWKTGTATAGKWVLPSGLADYPMGKVDRRVAQRLCR
jgi:A/G-specific adenine glycosylase